MSNVLFFPVKYEPTEAEKIQFYFLQSSATNFIREVEKLEKDKYWQVFRIEKMANFRREKFELIKNEKGDL